MRSLPGTLTVTVVDSIVRTQANGRGGRGPQAPNRSVGNRCYRRREPPNCYPILSDTCPRWVPSALRLLLLPAASAAPGTPLGFGSTATEPLLGALGVQVGHHPRTGLVDDVLGGV